MQKIEIIEADAFNHDFGADGATLVFTDPPYELAGEELGRLFKKIGAPHVFLVANMRQVVACAASMMSDYKLAFDCAFDLTTPRRPKRLSQPHYTHANGVYWHALGVKSAFDRTLRRRSDQFEAKGYWPTVIKTTRGGAASGFQKGLDATIDVIGSFAGIGRVVDPFGGAGTTALAARSLNLGATLTEIDPALVAKANDRLRFFG